MKIKSPPMTRKGKSSSKPTSTSLVVKTAVVPTTQGGSRRKKKKRTKKNKRGKLSFTAKSLLVSQLFPPVTSARIMDSCEIPTNLVTLTADFVVVANAQNVAGAYLQLFGYPAYYTEGSASTDNTILYNTVSSFAAISAFQSAFTVARPVSASMEVIPTMSTLSDSGEIQCFSLAGNSTTLFDVQPTSSAQILSSRDNRTYTVREGAFLRYKYFDEATSCAFSATSAGFTRGVLGFHCTGLASGAGFRVRVVCNYECVPSADTLSFQTPEPSPSDPVTFEYVKSLMAKVSSFSSWESIRDIVDNSLGTIASAVENGRNAWTVADRLVGLFEQMRAGRFDDMQANRLALY